MADGLDIEPVVVPTIDLAHPQLLIGVDITAGVEIPGLALGVEHVRAGIEITFTDAAGKPKLGFGGLVLEPPTGMSAALTLPGVAGGGALSRVGDQWRGALEANLGFVSLTGFGLLDTDEFGFLVILAAEFIPPIQLSFGFTLVGVGGIVGINHHPDRDRISAAVASGDLSKLLFPRDPVADADRLLPVLADCFPRKQGSFVIGPMIKIGWGTPTIVAATIGILIADDSLTILGRLAVTLPFEQVDLIHLEAIVVGRIDADGLAIDASLANSNVVMIPVEGDLRVRVRGGDNGLFAFSAGGFHPALQPPQGMTGMRRVGAHLSPGPILSARLEAYVAVTSNSVQFGAHVDLQAGVSGFGIRGHAAFDAFFIFAPSFRFEATFSASVSVVCADFDVASISLDALLAGPAPWRIRGHASISILFWDVDVDIPELTWGPQDATALPPAADPAQVLKAQLEQAAGWAATSQAVPHLVQLRPGADTQKGAIHPLAEIAFVQHAVPLNTELKRMDGIPLAKPVTVNVIDKTTGQTLPASQPQEFVPRQFFEIDDATQRSSAGTETLPGGFVVEPAAPRVGSMSQQDDTYKITVLEEHRARFRFQGQLSLTARRLAHHQGAPAAKLAQIVAIRDPGDVVVSRRDTLAATGLARADGFPLGAAGAAALIRSSTTPQVLQGVGAWEVPA